MKIEVVTVCVGYGDFLAVTLAENLPLVDDLVVITSPDDAETIKVCRRHNLRYVLTNDHKRGGLLNKARLINRALDMISGADWILHLDADIVLPRSLRKLLDVAHLDETCIYGADRQNVVGFEKWAAFKKYVGAWDNHLNELGHWFHPDYPVSSRLVSRLHGYAPIGCFQLFHGSQTVVDNYHEKSYPTEHADAARTDIQFALQWDRQKRILLPEVILLHLESEPAAMGANWAGRTTARFEPRRDDRRHEHEHRPPHHHHNPPSCRTENNA